jgi:hypothetical protein
MLSFRSIKKKENYIQNINNKKNAKININQAC